VNADEIAKGISPFEPESVSFEAGRIMLQRIFYLIGEQEIFAFETTLATRSYQSLIRFAKNHGYQVYILFFHLNNVELAKERVAGRVKRGVITFQMKPLNGDTVEGSAISSTYLWAFAINGVCSIIHYQIQC
jgi:predicted ABC-type ATPase